MTRDGTFRIRDGKVAEPLRQSPLHRRDAGAPRDVPGLTRDTLLVNERLSTTLGVRVPRAGDRDRRVQRDGRGFGILVYS